MRFFFGISTGLVTKGSLSIKFLLRRQIMLPQPVPLNAGAMYFRIHQRK